MLHAIKLSGLSEKETLEIIPENTLLLGYIGSIAHGTYLPNSDPNSVDDKDIMGICIADKKCYLGLGNFEQKQVMKDSWDSVVYEIRKFFRLLLKQNPNVLGLLWLQEKDYIYIDPCGKLILENRDIFTSKQVYHSFIGYGKAQLYKMTHNACTGHLGAKRKALIEKYLFDVKNAAHTIRLLRSGIEYLTDGILRVFREDAQELKEIKRGEWPLEKVVAEADRLFKLAQEAFVRSPLKPQPDYKAAEELLIKILDIKLKEFS